MHASSRFSPRSWLVALACALALVLSACGGRKVSKDLIGNAGNIPASFDVTLVADKDTQFDYDGAPLTDPAKSGEGLLLPIGGHKGSGLALALGLLAGTLNGAAFGRDVVDFNADDETACDTGHFLIVLDVSKFLSVATFKVAMKARMSSPSSAGSREADTIISSTSSRMTPASTSLTQGIRKPS